MLSTESSSLESNNQDPIPLQMARVALSLGFAPIPLNGKRPFLRGWQHLTAEEGFRRVQRCPKNNIGVLTGQVSGITVVDIDTKDRGMETWVKWVQRHPFQTLTVQTGGGGLHYYFQYDPDLTNRTRVQEIGIDIRNDGGQVVFVGSIHPETGQYYRFDPSSFDSSGRIIISRMPEWLRQQLL